MKRDTSAQTGSHGGIAPDAAGIEIPIVIASRHVHLTHAAIEQLFCDRYRLHASKTGADAPEFSTIESVTLVGPAGRIRNVPVVGPPWPFNQVEISRTDAIALGVRAPIRESGDLIGSPGILLEGPRTHVRLGTGVICAQRHIHLTPLVAERLALADRDRVEVETHGSHRGMVFRDVLVRVAPGYRFELHLDSDEANAAGLQAGDHAVLNIRARR